MHKAALNSVYFDIQTRSVDNRIITLDLQRVYSKERIRKRTIYYACREIASQKVEKSKYEDLESVIVTFILTEAPLKHTVTNRKIKLIDEAAVADPSVLDHLSEEDKYMIRLTEEERLQERAEGKEQGLQQKSIEIAKNLLSEGMTITFISKMTGLSEEEVALLV